MCSGVSIGFGGGRGAFVADVRDAIDGRLRATSADGEVHRAVLADHGIGQRQAACRRRTLRVLRNSRALRREMHRVHRSVGPIASVNGVLIGCGKGCAEPRDDARGRAGTDVQQRRHDVGTVSEQLARRFAEAVVAAADEMIDARRAIPRRADVPLHVTVVREEIAECVEGDVEVIAKSGDDHLEAFAVRRDFAGEGLRLGVGKNGTLRGARHAPGHPQTDASRACVPTAPAVAVPLPQAM